VNIICCLQISAVKKYQKVDNAFGKINVVLPFFGPELCDLEKSIPCGSVYSRNIQKNNFFVALASSPHTDRPHPLKKINLMQIGKKVVFASKK
jgi:hypothetical protein